MRFCPTLPTSIFVCLLLASACSSSNDSHPTPIDVDAVKEIGTEGGTLATPDGSVILTVPSNAIADTTQFTIKVTDAKTLPLGLNTTSSTAVFGPSGSVFAAPLTATLRYDQGNMEEGSFEERILAVLYVDDASNPVYAKVLSRDLAQNTVTAEIPHFSEVATAAAAGRQLLNGQLDDPFFQAEQIASLQQSLLGLTRTLSEAEREALLVEIAQRSADESAKARESVAKLMSDQLTSLDARERKLAEAENDARTKALYGNVITGLKGSSSVTDALCATAYCDAPAASKKPFTCTSSKNCYDIDECTIDICTEDGTCWHKLDVSNPACVNRFDSDSLAATPYAPACTKGGGTGAGCSCESLGCASESCCTESAQCINNPCDGVSCNGVGVCHVDCTQSTGFSCGTECAASACTGSNNPDCSSGGTCTCGDATTCTGNECCRGTTCVDTCAGVDCKGLACSYDCGSALGYKCVSPQ